MFDSGFSSVKEKKNLNIFVMYLQGLPVSAFSSMWGFFYITSKDF